jgi:hypothetical protein
MAANAWLSAVLRKIRVNWCCHLPVKIKWVKAKVTLEEATKAQSWIEV